MTPDGTTPDKEMLERQAEDMYGRPTGPRHEELGARSRELEAAPPRHPEQGREPRRGEPEPP